MGTTTTELDELEALFNGMCADDKPRLAAMRRAALYLQQRGRNSANAELFAGKQDPKLSGSGVCTRCGLPAQSRSHEGVCTRCAT